MKKFIGTLNVVTGIITLACVGCELYETITGNSIADKIDSFKSNIELKDLKDSLKERVGK